MKRGFVHGDNISVHGHGQHKQGCETVSIDSVPLSSISSV